MNITKDDAIKEICKEFRSPLTRGYFAGAVASTSCIRFQDWREICDFLEADFVAYMPAQEIWKDIRDFLLSKGVVYIGDHRIEKILMGQISGWTMDVVNDDVDEVVEEVPESVWQGIRSEFTGKAWKNAVGIMKTFVTENQIQIPNRNAEGVFMSCLNNSDFRKYYGAQSVEDKTPLPQFLSRAETVWGAD